MTEAYRNRAIGFLQPPFGYENMSEFFMARNPGQIGAMLGRYDERELPLPVFLDTLHVGLAQQDAEPLAFLYGSVANFMGSKQVVCGYDRFGEPWVKMRGGTFPHTRIIMDMTFLTNGEMTRRTVALSDKLVLPAYSDSGLRSVISEKGITVDTTGFYPEMAAEPDIAAQLSRYPDLAAAVADMESREEDPFTIAVKEVAASLEGNWKVYAPPPPRGETMKAYQVSHFKADVDCFIPTTLNEIVAQVQRVVPAIEQTYQKAQDTFLPQR